VTLTIVWPGAGTEKKARRLSPGRRRSRISVALLLLSPGLRHRRLLRVCIVKIDRCEAVRPPADVVHRRAGVSDSQPDVVRGSAPGLEFLRQPPRSTARLDKAASAAAGFFRTPSGRPEPYVNSRALFDGDGVKPTSTSADADAQRNRCNPCTRACGSMRDSRTLRADQPHLPAATAARSRLPGRMRPFANLGNLMDVSRRVDHQTRDTALQARPWPIPGGGHDLHAVLEGLQRHRLESRPKPEWSKDRS